MSTLAEVADQFVAQYNEILGQCGAWLRVKEDYKKYLNDRDLLMLGMKAAMLQHKARLHDSQQYLLATTGDDEVAQFLVREDFSATGLSLFIEVDWSVLFFDEVAWVQLQQFYDIVLLGLALAHQWGSEAGEAPEPSILEAAK